MKKVLLSFFSLVFLAAVSSGCMHAEKKSHEHGGKTIEKSGKEHGGQEHGGKSW